MGFRPGFFHPRGTTQLRVHPIMLHSMNAIALPQPPPSWTQRIGHIPSLLAATALWLVVPLGATEVAVDPVPVNDAIVSLAAYNVQADRIEDFGLRVESETYSGKQANLATLWFSTYAPRISVVLPHTAAAKAGLKPGERILKSEGRSTVGGLFSTGKFGHWHKTQAKKWAEVAAGKKNVTWTLEVESPGTRAVRTVDLVVPSLRPCWGASVWQKPGDRSSARVTEPGPLAARSQAVLDHGINAMVTAGLVAPTILETVFGRKIPPDEAPNGFAWQFDHGREGMHRIVVTQFRGRTDIVLQMGSPAAGFRIYLTSPSGKLEQAWQWRRGKLIEDTSAETLIGFEHEVALWSTKVVNGTGRWPFEIVPGYDADAIFAVLAPTSAKPAANVARPLAATFLMLPPATDAEQALFAEAYGKLGADHDRWAYTETSRRIEDDRVVVTRVDPSQPEDRRCRLLSLDGRIPTIAEAKQWRDDGGDLVKPLAETPPLASLVDFKDLRVLRDEAEATVFELPIRSDNETFPTEKFQALFRVDKTQRAFAEITVSLRDTFRVAGLVKVTDAGLAIRFATLDPTLAPQPVHLSMGGGIRVLLVRFARSFEATRTDFVPAAPSDAPPNPASNVSGSL